MKPPDWVQELPAEVMVCGVDGTILAMNTAAERLFAEQGGTGLLGSNVLDCHPEPSRSKLEGMLARQVSNAFYNTEADRKRFFVQAPWYQDGRYAGFVEISFEVPEEVPHFVRA